jgi:hypothetical protein
LPDLLNACPQKNIHVKSSPFSNFGFGLNNLSPNPSVEDLRHMCAHCIYEQAEIGSNNGTSKCKIRYKHDENERREEKQFYF